MNYIEVLLFSKGGETVWLETTKDIVYAPVFKLPEIHDMELQAVASQTVFKEYGIDLDSSAFKQFHLRMMPDHTQMPICKGMHHYDMVHSYRVWLPDGKLPAKLRFLPYSVGDILSGRHSPDGWLKSDQHLNWLLPLALDPRIEHSYTRWK